MSAYHYRACIGKIRCPGLIEMTFHRRYNITTFFPPDSRVVRILTFVNCTVLICLFILASNPTRVIKQRTNIQRKLDVMCVLLVLPRNSFMFSVKLLSNIPCSTNPLHRTRYKRLENSYKLLRFEFVTL